MSDLKPGKYRMTVEVEIDEEGYLLPHDSGEMFMADWWAQNDATFEPVPPPQCAECGWWLTTSPASCPSCDTPTGLGVSGEGRSEPTPAPREPRVWRHGVHKDIDQDVNEVAGTMTGRRWKRMPDKQFVWTSSGCAYSAGTVLYVENEVSEVISPEGTS